MLAALADGTPLPADIREQVIMRTDGVPLFVEELVKMLQESRLSQVPTDHSGHAAPGRPLTIPASLQDALMARLDRLGSARDLAQLGATWGREFTYEQMQSLLPQEETTLRQHLRQLVEAEILYQRGFPPQASYRFKHALIQETAYQSLVRSTRQHYHHKVAEVLATQFPEVAAGQPELLAYHYTEAGQQAQAVPYWQQAGQQALERSASIEAAAHLQQGLAALMTLPDTPERAQLELPLQLTLGRALMAARGYGASEVGDAYARARMLCRSVGETPQLFPVLRGLAAFYYVRAEYKIAQELGEQCLTLAERMQDPRLLLRAHTTLGQICLFLGEYPAAWRHLEQATRLYAPPEQGAHVIRAVQDPGVTCFSLAAPTLWLLGYPAQARQRSREALALAEELAHPFSQAEALIFAAVLHICTREAAAVQEYAEAAIAYATAQGFPHWQAHGTIYRGWALTMQGQGEVGIAHIRAGQTTWRTIGGALAWPWFLTLLTEAYAHVGQIEAGLAVLSEALEGIVRSNERHYESELYRLKGELLLLHDHSAEVQAEYYLSQALDGARRQQAKSLELRASLSLGRLWQRQGKRAAARQLLSASYGWFTEGFDLHDLQAAQALLADLAT
jgi:predicted ATPase